MRRLCALLAVTALVACAAAGAGTSATATPSPAQVVARFKTLTGAKLLVDPRSGYPGHYTALGLVQSIGNIGRWGRFTVFVTTSGSEDDVTSLLADSHTGQLGTPGPGSIYWEHGHDLEGSQYWLAKRRYGANLVLYWYGSQQKVDSRFTRLHRALTTIAAAF